MMQDDRDFKIVRSVVYTCRLLGERPSAAKVIASLKALTGKGIRKAEVCAHMKRLFAEEHLSGNLLGTITELSGTEPEPILSTTGTDREQTGTIPEHHAQILNKKLEIEYKDVALNGKPSEPIPEKPKRQRRELENDKPLALTIRVIKPLDAPGQPEWVVQMRRAASALSGKKLSAYTIDERFLIAQYHAWRWGNCTRDERANRKRATEIAAGIRNLACHREHGEMTTDDYIIEAEAVWRQRGCSPWYKPWDITARFDPVPAQAQKARQQWQAT